MKPRYSNRPTTALTFIEMLVIIAVLVVVAAALLPAFFAAKRKPQKINCVNNLKEIGIAFRVWEGDNKDKFPPAVSVTNGGATELIATGNVAACFVVMSNELTTPKLLHCPEDTRRQYATNFSTGFDNTNISYFVGLDADERNPQMFLSGDDNLAVAGIPVKIRIGEPFNSRSGHLGFGASCCGQLAHLDTGTIPTHRQHRLGRWKREAGYDG